MPDTLTQPTPTLPVDVVVNPTSTVPPAITDGPQSGPRLGSFLAWVDASNALQVSYYTAAPGQATPQQEWTQAVPGARTTMPPSVAYADTNALFVSWTDDLTDPAAWKSYVAPFSVRPGGMSPRRDAPMEVAWPGMGAIRGPAALALRPRGDRLYMAVLQDQVSVFRFTTGGGGARWAPKQFAVVPLPQGNPVLAVIGGTVCVAFRDAAFLRLATSSETTPQFVYDPNWYLPDARPFTDNGPALSGMAPFLAVSWVEGGTTSTQPLITHFYEVPVPTPHLIKLKPVNFGRKPPQSSVTIPATRGGVAVGSGARPTSRGASQSWVSFAVQGGANPGEVEVRLLTL
jgi:hypothetical protein